MACEPGAMQCYIQELVVVLAPYILTIILVLAAIFILPKAGWKGVVVSLLVLFGVLWWWGIIPGMPSLQSILGTVSFTVHHEGLLATPAGR